LSDGWKFQVYEDRAGEYRWRLRASNGRIVADSGEGYVYKFECKDMIRKIQVHAPYAEIEDLTGW
jgi:uncharacterized protein YegP (UPF0339 family)